MLLRTVKIPKSSASSPEKMRLWASDALRSQATEIQLGIVITSIMIIFIVITIVIIVMIIV